MKFAGWNPDSGFGSGYGAEASPVLNQLADTEANSVARSQVEGAGISGHRRSRGVRQSAEWSGGSWPVNMVARDGKVHGAAEKAL